MASWSLDETSGRRLVVVGQFDLADEARFVSDVDELIDQRSMPVTLDLSGLDFLDSSGVRALLVVQRQHGDLVEVGAMSDEVRRVLRIAGVLGDGS